jgi:hypothetical protein
MSRPLGDYGLPEPYLAKTGQSIFDADLTALPVTQAIRASFTGATPVATADFAAAVLVAVHNLEQRVIALEP